MKNREYFQVAEQAANERYFSSNGEWDEFGDEWDEFGDEWDEFDDDEEDYETEEDYDMASGHSLKEHSQPYIVRIANSTSSAVNNVIILDAYTHMADTNNFGNPVAIALSIVTTNVTYIQFLRQTASQPFEVGEIYLQSSTTAQVTETITVRWQDATGQRLDKVLTPIRDPYQFQNGSITHTYQHMIDGYTRYTINSILASATLDIYMYPKAKINLGRAVRGRKAMKLYSNPNIVRKRTVVNIQAGGGRRRGRKMRRLSR